MSNYYIGIDMGKPDGDETWIVISKQPGRVMRFINRLLRRGDRWKIVYSGTDTSQIDKWRYRGAKITESI